MTQFGLWRMAAFRPVCGCSAFDSPKSALRQLHCHINSGKRPSANGCFLAASRRSKWNLRGAIFVAHRKFISPGTNGYGRRFMDSVNLNVATGSSPRSCGVATTTTVSSTRSSDAAARATRCAISFPWVQEKSTSPSARL